MTSVRITNVYLLSAKILNFQLFFLMQVSLGMVVYLPAFLSSVLSLVDFIMSYIHDVLLQIPNEL